MNRLTKQQVAVVKERIGSGGVITPELIEDLLDHLCTSIETEIDKGLSFEAASEKIFSQLSEDELKLTEMETQKALEGKEIYYPNISQSVGLIGSIWVVTFFVIVIGSNLVNAFGARSYITLFNLILQYLILGGAIVLAAKWISESQSGQIFSFRKVSPYVYVVIIIISLLTAFWLDPLRSLNLISLQSLKTYSDSISKLGLSPLLVSFSLLFMLELLIRGIILHGLLKTLTPGWSIFWSSVFAVTFSYAYPLQTLIINLLMGWVYWKTKSLHATFVMISTWLGANVLTKYLMGNRNEDLIGFSWRALFGNFNLYATLVALAFLVTFGLFYFLSKKLSNTQKIAS